MARWFPPGNKVILTQPASIIAIAFVVGLIAVACWRTSAARSAPYVPTPHSTVRKMLDIAAVGPDDILYDLGSGDGRLAIAAVRDYGAERAIGIDVDFRRIRESRRHADAAGVRDRVRFIEGDLFKQDFSSASVVTVFMLPQVLGRLRPLLLDRLAPGTRLVSQQFGMDDWEPDLIARDGRRDVFLWYVPARVEGYWKWCEGAGKGRRQASLMLSQRFQNVTGTLEVEGFSCEARDGRLRGRELAFEVVDDGRRLGQFVGYVEDERIVGTFAGREIVAGRAG